MACQSRLPLPAWIGYCARTRSGKRGALYRAGITGLLRLLLSVNVRTRNANANTTTQTSGGTTVHAFEQQGFPHSPSEQQMKNTHALDKHEIAHQHQPTRTQFIPVRVLTKAREHGDEWMELRKLIIKDVYSQNVSPENGDVARRQSAECGGK